MDILLQPCITVYFDVDQAEGIYGTIGLSHSFDLPDSKSVSWSLDLTTRVGLGSSPYVDYYFGVQNAAFTDFYAEGSLPVTIFDQLTITPYIGVAVVLDTSLREQTDQSDNFLFGALLSWSI